MNLRDIREARAFAASLSESAATAAPYATAMVPAHDLKQAARLIESLGRELARAKHAIVASRRHLKEFAE